MGIIVGIVVGIIVGIVVGTVVISVPVVLGTVVTTVVTGVVGIIIAPGDSRLETVAIELCWAVKPACKSLYPASLKTTWCAPTGTAMIYGVTTFVRVPSIKIAAPWGVVEK